MVSSTLSQSNDPEEVAEEYFSFFLCSLFSIDWGEMPAAVAMPCKEAVLADA